MSGWDSRLSTIGERPGGWMAKADPRERDQNPISIDDLLSFFSFAGLNYPFLSQGTLNQKAELPDPTFEGYVQSMYRGNGVVFACMLRRMLVFSDVRFQWQRVADPVASGAAAATNEQALVRALRAEGFEDNTVAVVLGAVRGRPGKLWGSTELSILEKPWRNGTAGDLAARAITDADLGGSFYVRRQGVGADVAKKLGMRQTEELFRMRPDWVTIVVGSDLGPSQDESEPTMWDDDAQLLGYLYQPGGPRSAEEAVFYDVSEVAHWAPVPDPTFRFRGMSWLTPILREFLGDRAAETHKLKYFENGAPQPLDAKVLTPAGWATMGEMAPGSEVIGSDGRAKRVLAVYPQGERDIYRVTFTDGASTECTKDHLWRVQCGNGDALVLPLADIVRRGLAWPSGNPRWSVPYADPAEFATADPVPLDPYLLGMLLGDGSFRGNGKGSGCVSLAGHAEDAEVTELALASTLPPGVGMHRRDRPGLAVEWVFSGGYVRPNPLTDAVRRLGLFDVLGHDKFIPWEYMTASVGERLALLQGLVDSDGHVDGSNVSVTTNSRILAGQLVDLVGSLGGWATAVIDARDAGAEPQRYRVRIKRLPAWMVPCRLGRKVDRYRSAGRVQRRRYIASVEMVGRKPAQCISVNSLDHLYVTDDYILTHNTPNLVVTMGNNLSPDKFEKWVEKIEKGHKSMLNAYKTLYLGAGSTAQAIGNSLEQVTFKDVQGKGETRIAAASGVPPVLAGLSEGLSSATYSNYSQARHAFGDMTIRPLWRNFCGSLEAILKVPGGSRLWYDDRDIPFLREDGKDLAIIEQTEAATIASLITAGYEPDSVVDAVINHDWTRLTHTGMPSVQLQPGGAPAQPALPAPAKPPAPNGKKPKAAPAAPAPAGGGA